MEGTGAFGTNLSNGVPGSSDVASLSLTSGKTLTVSSGSNAVNQLVETGAGGSLVISGGSFSTVGLSDIAGTLAITGGTLNLSALFGVTTLTQSGGELTGSGTVTATGVSTFSDGTESGSGTTIAAGGAAFTSTGFGLDGGRTLQLGGSSTATGTFVQKRGAVLADQPRSIAWQEPGRREPERFNMTLACLDFAPATGLGSAGAGGPAMTSGASRSSSPATPTRANSAYRRAQVSAAPIRCAASTSLPAQTCNRFANLRPSSRY